MDHDEVVHAFAQAQPKGGANLLHRGLLAHWRPLDASLDEPDGRLTVFNLIAARANSITTMDALLKRNQQTHPLELTLRAGVRAVLVELGSVTARSAQWRRVDYSDRIRVDADLAELVSGLTEGEEETRQCLHLGSGAATLVQ